MSCPNPRPGRPCLAQLSYYKLPSSERVTAFTTHMLFRVPKRLCTVPFAATRGVQEVELQNIKCDWSRNHNFFHTKTRRSQTFMGGRLTSEVCRSRKSLSTQQSLNLQSNSIPRYLQGLNKVVQSASQPFLT